MLKVPMLKNRRRALVAPVLVLSVVGLAGCGTSGDAAGGGLSLVDKAKTAQICVKVASSVQSAADVGAKVAQGAITQTEAAAQLEPIATEVASLAEQNAALPIAKNLQKLSEHIVALQKVSPDAPTVFRAAAESLASQAKVVVADCAAIGQ
ncbi:MAG: hypothetical protein ACYDC9_09240 [Dermatophilaceae bacterium]